MALSSGGKGYLARRTVNSFGWKRDVTWKKKEDRRKEGNLLLRNSFEILFFCFVLFFFFVPIGDGMMALPLGYAKKKTFDRKTSVCCCDWDGATVIGYADEPDAYHFLWCNTPVHTGDTRNSWRTIELISNQFLDLLIILIVPHWLLFHCSLILSFPRTERIQNCKYTVLINDSDSITNGIYDYTNCVTDHRLMYWWREVIWLSSKIAQKKGGIRMAGRNWTSSWKKKGHLEDIVYTESAPLSMESITWTTLALNRTHLVCG